MKTINKKEFNKYIFSNIKETVLNYNLIEEDELIAVALSGGKDSVLTLYALNQLKKDNKIPNFKLIAISVDEGIKHYRNHGLETARQISNELEIKLVEKSFKEEFKYELDDIYSYFKSACIVCGIFRRTILNKTAHNLGVDKLATGHNLDDEIQSFLMSFARGDTIKFSKFGPKLNRIHPKLTPRIKPLWNLPEKDVGTWAVLNDINIHLDECPYSYLSLRSKIKNFLNQTESKNKGTKRNIMESFKKTFNITPPKANLKECQLCGEPCSGDICKTCETLKIIKAQKKL
ncbi:TIGR00269 family protein [Methanobrevibacter curvatus]|uniref:tRNA 2-thiocytidine biosynthesis protein TtcA n=1 Tax=Methanobrevibacter curvatus TaxID=49547 RepID=A0A166C1X2_9EURY|nr:TIGR00269 family protein [Methanobrevibacter curvatus]KZX10697.1 tRNA 2-thiocytidine biosynthesis protein TtcA [Methanobrevibacter curvatus]